MSLDYDKVWAPGETPCAPGVSNVEILAWEARHKVKLPAALCKALRRQNGGVVRYSTVLLSSLNEIVPVARNFWRHASFRKKKFPDLGLVFQFTSSEDEPIFFLNYNASGAEGEPTVYCWYHDPGEVRPVAKTVRRFLADLIDVTPTPTIDWSETTRLTELLFQERIDTKSDYDHVEEYDGREVYEEVVLGRLNGRLIHFTRGITLWGEELTRTELPEPLSRSDANIDQERPPPGRTYGLHLEPKDGDGIVSIESSSQPDGMWKSSVSQGVPVYITVESRDKEALKALRVEMFGKKAAQKAAEADDAVLQMQTLFGSLTPEQQQAAAAAFAGEMIDQLSEGLLDQIGEGVESGALDDLDPEDAPEELRGLRKGMAEALGRARTQAEEQAQKASEDPEVAAVIEAMRRAAVADDEDDEDSADDADDNARKGEQ